ncbi:MAG: restriction endonuclease [Rikenellaceae bacterium]
MDWKEYEDIVYEECQRIFRDATIIKDTHIKGIYSQRQRQIDILVKDCTIDGKICSIVVDAKYYSKKVDVKDVESFISMLKDVNIERGILVSSEGYTKSAINRAHYGENNIEVDVLNVGELLQFQSTVAFPYAGSDSAFIKAPFGWIIDAARRPGIIATLYKRGGDLLDAAKSNEFMYLQLYPKDEEVKTIDDLVKKQNMLLLQDDANARFEKFEIENIVIRKARVKGYPTIETTAFRDFDDFVLFIVLFCPDNIRDRDINKMIYTLKSALPLKVRYKDSE